MKIALVSPIIESVPPRTYGGIELVVYNLCEEWSKMGHEVTVFASGDSVVSGRLRSVIDKSVREMNSENYFNYIFYDNCHLANVINNSRDFDIVHNHLGISSFPFLSLVKSPVITTLHWSYSKEEQTFINRYNNLGYIAISESQRRLLTGFNASQIEVVYNGIDSSRYDYGCDKGDYLLFLGRMSPEKGPDVAIDIAKRSGRNLVLAGKISSSSQSFYDSKIKPYIDGQQITYVGEVNHPMKVKLLKNAYATLCPAIWDEPFGLIMVESMACGTPVIASNKGAAVEILINGVTGFLYYGVDGAVSAVRSIDLIDRKVCRKRAEFFSSETMAKNYLQKFSEVVVDSRMS